MFKKVIFLLILISVLACDASLSTKEIADYTVKGKEITEASFLELSNNLMSQMKMGGPSQAISFCSLQAIPITSQLSEKYNVTIKRTSDKIRNLDNKSTQRELQLINNYKNEIAQNAELKPIVEVDDAKKIHFYAPIIVQAKCLTCHGKLNETVAVQTDSILKSLYPNDKAIGYEEGDLRGIWSITFKN